jgi:hypothetical protein
VIAEATKALGHLNDTPAAEVAGRTGPLPAALRERRLLAHRGRADLAQAARARRLRARRQPAWRPARRQPAGRQPRRRGSGQRGSDRARLPEGGYYYAVIVLERYKHYTRKAPPPCATSSDMQKTDYGYPHPGQPVKLALTRRNPPPATGVPAAPTRAPSTPFPTHHPAKAPTHAVPNAVPLP